MRLIKRGLAALLCLVVMLGVIPLDATTAKAEPLPQTKTISITVKQNGVHPASYFPATRSYDDGQYAGTLTRQNNTLKNIVRITPTVTYTYQSDIKYPNDKPAAGQFSFPATYAASYYDAVSGQSFPATLTKSGSPYYSGAVTVTPLYWDHEGYEYDPINNTKLGYMSNNSSTYYSGQHRYSDPPRQPATYYGPPAEEGLGWVQYKAPEWDGALQDAETEPWRSLCIFYFGVARFRSVSGALNRYRKPVRIFYSRTANSQYIYQNYSGTATVMDTEITYTGVVSLQLPDLTVTSLTTNKAVYETGETVTVTAVVRNIGQTAANNFIVRLSSSPSVTTQNRTLSLAAGASATLSYTFTAPTVLDNQSIALTVMADADNVIAESNEDNNSRTTTIMITAILPDLTFGDDSTILSSYYADKDIVISVQVRNLTAQSVPSVDVRLTLGNETKTEQICVPGNGINIVVFRIRTPKELGTYPVLLTIDPDNKIPEQPPDGENNNQSNANGTIRYDGSSGSVKIDIVELVRNDLPDPADLRMEADHYARNKGVPELPTLAKSASHSWTEYRYENGLYVQKSYWSQLTTTFEINPDPRVHIKGHPNMMESGFGVYAIASTSVYTNYDNPEKIVGPQMYWVFYPETSYWMDSAWSRYADSLEYQSGVFGQIGETAWQYAVSMYTVTESHLHYTPVWFPDGLYEAVGQSFYAWSPAGQMYEQVSDTVEIDGNMYERFPVLNR